MYDAIGSVYPAPVLTAPVVSRIVTAEPAELILYLPRLKTRLAMDEGLIDYDQALLDLLSTALSQVEQYTGLALQPGTVSVAYAGYAGQILPYGPVLSAPAPVVISRAVGSTITLSNATTDVLTGLPFPSVNVSFTSGTVSYTSGYALSVSALLHPLTPAGLVGAVVEHAASAFRMGGQTETKINVYWKTLAGPFRRFD